MKTVLKSVAGLALGLLLGWIAFVKLQLLPVTEFALSQQSRRIDALESRVSVLATNATLSLATLSRAEEIVGRIEREMRERQEPHWTPIPNLPIPTNEIIQPFYWQQGIMLTNLIVIQDAQGNWQVKWPTNNNPP